MRKHLRLLLLIALALPIPVLAAVSAWDEWDRDLKARCPNNNVLWLCGSCFYELTNEFNSKLHPQTRERVERIANLETHCAEEGIGFYCHTGRFLVAYRKLGLLRSLTRFSCANVQCEEPASCSKYPWATIYGS